MKKNSMGKSSRSIKKNQPAKPIEDNSVRYTTTSKNDFLKKKNDKISSEKSNFRFLKWGAITSSIFILLLISGIFSPGPSPNDFINHEDLPENPYVQANGEKMSVVLYSSPTCGCCHNYVDYLNDNGFDTFQKRTQDYLEIKNENLVPEDQRSCHTVIMGDYFIEGHIPLSVVFDLLSQSPDIDGISLPDMPSGTPGMDGEKNSEWVVSSILNGQVVNVFARV